MPGQSISVCEELERSMGKFEYRDERHIRQLRSLLTANEIRELDESLIFCGNKRAIKTTTIPYFKQFFKNRLTKLPPYEPKSTLSTAFPELIQLPD